MFKIGVFGIVTDNQNRVLLCHRNDHDFWNLPGGGLDDLESPWNGVVREIKEETGLNAEVVKLVCVYSKSDKSEIVFLFQCKVVGGEITLNEEAKDIKYFDFDKIPSNTFPNHIERIKDFFENKNNIVTLKNQNSFTTGK